MLSLLNDVLDKYIISNEELLVKEETLQITKISEEYSFLNSFSFGSNQTEEETENVDKNEEPTEEQAPEEEEKSPVNVVEILSQIQLRTQQELSPVYQYSPRQVQHHESTPRFLKRHSMNLLNLRRSSVVTFEMNELSAYLKIKQAQTNIESPINTERRFSVNYFNNDLVTNVRRGSMSLEKMRNNTVN